MYIETFLLVSIGLTALLAVPALALAKRAGNVTFADVVLPVAPAILFIGALLTFNQSAQIGLAIIIYPLGLMAVSLILLYMRVLVLGRSSEKRSGLPAALLVVACLFGLVLGLVVPPWYE